MLQCYNILRQNGGQGLITDEEQSQIASNREQLNQPDEQGFVNEDLSSM